MNPEKIKRLVREGKVYDLGQDYYVGMPHHPNHPPFAFSLTKVHGEVVYEGGVSSSNCLFTTGGHTGTHLDAHGHFSRNGQVYGVGDIGPFQDYQGLKKGGIDKVSPVLTRGVLLDIAGLDGTPCLNPDYAIGVDALEKACERQDTRIEKRDAVLIRTGWGQYFENAQKYTSHDRGCPGLNENGAHWIVERGAAYVGSDTLALEKTPSPNFPVHVVLLVENGIHIIEAMNLEDIARDRVYEFLFMASPLKIRGGTASPVRPIAVC